MKPEKQDSILERQRDLARLGGLLERTVEGRGEIAAVVGPAGIGKSELLERTVLIAGELGARTLTANGQFLERGFPFGLARRLLPSDIMVPVAWRGDERDLQVIFDKLTRAVLKLAADRALALIVDDVDSADVESIRLLVYLRSRIAAAPVALIVGVTSGQGAPAGSLLEAMIDGCLTVRPAPLSHAGVAALLHETLGKQIRIELTQATLRWTGGIPALATAVAKDLVAVGLGPADMIPAQAERSLPAGVRSSISSRLHRLSQEATTVAHGLAVLGGPARTSHIAAVTGLAADEVLTGLDSLAAAGFVEYDEARESRSAFSLRPPIVCESVYSEIGFAERGRLHRRAAQALAENSSASLEEIATHMLSAEPGCEEWAARVLAAAGQAALERGMPGFASDCLSRSFDEMPQGGDSDQRLRALAEAEIRQGRDDVAERILNKRVATVRDPVRRAELMDGLATVLARSGRAGDGAELVASALEALSADDHTIGIKLEAHLVVLADLDAEAGSLLAGRKPIFTLDGETAPGEHRNTGLVGLSDEQLNRGTAERAVEASLIALDGGRLIEREPPGSIMTFQFANTLLLCDALDEAENAFTHAIEYVVAQGSPEGAKSFRGFRAGARQRRGDLSAAIVDARAPLELIPPTSVPGLFIAGFLLEALIDSGEHQEAEKLLTERAIGGDLPRILPALGLMHARSRLRLELGDPDAALAGFLDCGELMEGWGMKTPASTCWQAEAAGILHGVGETDRARGLIRDGVASAREFGGPRPLGMMLAAQARIEDDSAGFHAAVEVLSSSPSRLEWARSLVGLGEMLLAKSGPDEARRPLQAGLRLARVCNAAPLSRRAYASLESSGARPRRITRSGPDTLTPSERRVAELVSQGQSNRQVAESLVVSVRTVETHLSRVFQKLNVHAREELAPALGEREA